MADPTFNEMTLRHLKKELPDIDLFSREFLFDKRHALSRSKVLIFGSPAGPKSRLSFLLRDAILEQHRTALFPGDYDLGNLRSLLPAFCAIDHTDSLEKTSLIGELSEDLESAGQINADEFLEASDLKKLKKDLAALTGRSMEQHYRKNKSTALKVMKLLFRLGRDRWSTGSQSEDFGSTKFQLFDLLKWPGGDERNRYSLSLRNTFPYQGPSSNPKFKSSEEVAALISDLKSYLSVELDDKTYEAISDLPAALHWHLNSIEHNIEKLLPDTDKIGYGDAVNIYNHLADLIDLKEVNFDISAENIALDEELFLYLHTLEFAHFAEAYPRLLDKSDPRCDIVPIGPAIDELAKALTENDALGMFDPIITDEDYFLFFNSQEEILCRVVGAALCEKMTKSALRNSAQPALHLMQTFSLFRKQPFEHEKHSTFSLLEVIAALCCVRQEQARSESERTKHKPYWKGQQAQGGSILKSLKVSPWNNHPAEFSDAIPEEHRLIWTSRFEWFLDALQGHTELTVQRFRLRSALARRAKAIVKTNNRAGMIDAMERLGELTFELGLHFLVGEEKPCLRQ
jgi:hypothetical protein